MNKEEFAVDEKTYENQDGMIIKIIFSNLGRRYKKIVMTQNEPRVAPTFILLCERTIQSKPQIIYQ